MHRPFTNEDILNSSECLTQQRDSPSQKSFLKDPVWARGQGNGRYSMLRLSSPATWGQSCPGVPRLKCWPQGPLEEQVLQRKGEGILHVGLPTARSMIFPLGWLPAITEWHLKPRSSGKHGVSSPAMSSGRAHKQHRFPHYPQTCVNIATAHNVTKKITSRCFPFSDIFCLTEFA